MAGVFKDDKRIVSMNNRDKYCFDDFTFENYRKLIHLAKAKGFQFIFHKDEFVPERKDIIWRHDVEFEPDYALRMAQIEHEEGVLATYFFQVHSVYYNIFNEYYRVVFQKIYEMGHQVGLHFDCRYWGVNDEKQLAEYITVDSQFIERNFGVKFETFSFHNTTPFTESCLEFKYGGLINVYSSFFKKHYKYCGDSLGYWRFDRLEDVLNDEDVKHLQVLTHDGNWNDEVLSPRKRFSKVMHDHAERLVQEQITGLHRLGMLCPDDEED